MGRNKGNIKVEDYFCKMKTDIEQLLSDGCFSNVAGDNYCYGINNPFKAEYGKVFGNANT